MSGEAARAWALAGLRAAGAWLWNRLRPRLLGLLAELGQRITARPVRSAAALLVLAAALLAGIRLAPAVYARHALAHAARIAAQQSRMKGTDQVLLELRHRAFELGLTEASLEPEAFRIEPGLSDDGPVCTVGYRFTHVVDFYGAFRLPMRMEGETTRPALDPRPNPIGVD